MNMADLGLDRWYYFLSAVSTNSLNVTRWCECFRRAFAEEEKILEDALNY